MWLLIGIQIKTPLEGISIFFYFLLNVVYVYCWHIKHFWHRTLLTIKADSTTQQSSFIVKIRKVWNRIMNNCGNNRFAVQYSYLHVFRCVCRNEFRRILSKSFKNHVQYCRNCSRPNIPINIVGQWIIDNGFVFDLIVAERHFFSKVQISSYFSKHLL